MESIDGGINKNHQVFIDHEKQTCRVCLRNGYNVMKNINCFIEKFQFLADVKVSDFDGLPQWLCNECFGYLQKSVYFKKKVLNAFNYVEQYANLLVDPKTGEEQELVNPISSLNKTKVLLVTIEKPSQNGSALNIEVFTHKSDDNADVKIKEEIYDSFGEEDNISLEVYKSELKDEPTDNNDGNSKPKRKKKCKKEINVKTKAKKQKNEYKETKVRIPRTKPVEVDPTKIRIIVMSLEEQILHRELEANSQSYLKFPFKCELCVKGFNYEIKLKNHMKKHDESRGSYECKLCKMHLPSLYSLSVHESTHSTRYECLKCGKRMTDKGSIIEHYTAVHDGVLTSYTCHLCGKVSNNNRTHRGHMRNHHGAERPECHHCGKTFINKDSLSEHILIHEGIKNHICSECGTKFRTNSQLKSHKYKHINDKHYYCVECDIRFKSAHNLRQHLMKAKPHANPSLFKYACNLCDTRVSTEAALQHHVTWGHEGRRIHACSECGLRLATKNSLNKHQRVAHKGYKPNKTHICPTCGRAFVGKNVLENHMRTHTGEKPFECSECGRKFTQRTAMQTHVKLVHLKLRKRNQPIKIKRECFPQDLIEKDVDKKDKGPDGLVYSWSGRNHLQ